MADAHTPVAAPPADPNATAPGTTRPTSGDFVLGAPVVAGELGAFGPYRVLNELGKGGMGAVYLALDTRLNRKIALKVMLPEFAAHVESNARFLREARAAALVEHANVVTVYEADVRDGVPYIAMQFLQGHPLDEYLKKNGSPPIAHCVRIAREAALGLAAAHERGLVHRDIKPANLWLEAPNARVKVLDFGLAKPIGTESEVTKSGAIVGTPSHMSPEQARGLNVDHRTDVFSLGTVLYRLCAGRNPFVGEHVMAVLTALATDDPTPVSELNPQVPAALADLIHQMLAKQPAARPQTAAEVAERLRTVLARPVDASVSLPVPLNPFEGIDDDTDRTERDAERLREPTPKRGKGLLLAGGGLALALLVAVVVALGTGGKKTGEVARKDEDPTAVPKGVPKTGTRTGTFPANPKAGDECDIEIAPNTKMRFCYIPPGECQLGSPKTERESVLQQLNDDRELEWYASENDDARGKFSTKGFWMGKYEVTQAEWAAVMRGTPLESPSWFCVGGRGGHTLGAITDTRRFPVEGVSWGDSQEFLNRANAHRISLNDKSAFCLPHEDEWEYACRGGLGNARPFYFGNELNGTQANSHGQFPLGTTTKGDHLQRPQFVGSYEAKARHPWGLCDMHGNVNEWCANVFSDADQRRVVRGASWDSAARYCRSAFRHKLDPAFREGGVGLRVLATRTP